MKGKSAEQRELQLNRKLANIKDVVELKKIYGNVEQQNVALRQDILNLKYKVDVLMQKQRNKPMHQTQEDQFKAKELQSTQKQLKLQYRIMKQLKKQQEQSKNERGTQQIGQHKLRIENELKNIQQQLTGVKRQASDLKSETTRLEKTLQQYQEQIVRNQPKIEQFEHQNSELRKKILSLKKVSTQKQYQSVKVMNSMYTIKTRFSKNQEAFHEEKKKMSSLKQQRLSKDQLLDLASLQRQVEDLRRSVKRKEKQHVLSENQNIKLRNQMTEKNKEDVKQLKECEDRKHRLNHELNKFKKVWNRHIELKNNIKNQKQYKTQYVQAQEFSPSQITLRKDFAGILGGKVQFDDRLALKDNLKSSIIGFYIYELDHATTAKNLLVGIRAIYDDQQANGYTVVPIPGNYLSKCKMSKYTLGEGDFVKLLKVKYNANQSRVIKLEIRTNKNNRYEFGDRRNFNDLVQGQNVYGFDISVQEYPVSLFGSYGTLRSQWFMESLGVEINDL